MTMRSIALGLVVLGSSFTLAACSGEAEDGEGVDTDATLAVELEGPTTEAQGIHTDPNCGSYSFDLFGPAMCGADVQSICQTACGRGATCGGPAYTTCLSGCALNFAGWKTLNCKKVATPSDA